MSPLTFLLFASFVTIPVTEAGARPGSVESILSYTSSEWLGDTGMDVDDTDLEADAVSSSSTRVSSAVLARTSILEKALMPFDPAAVRNTLGIINEDVLFFDVFVKVLTALKNKRLDSGIAEGFVERIFLLAVGTSFWPYIASFQAIVEVYGMLEEKQNRTEAALRDSVEHNLDLLFADYTGKGYHVLSKEVAPFVTKLIKDNGDNAEVIAKKIVSVLLLNSKVQKEVDEWTSRSSPKIGPAYDYVMGVIQYAEQKLRCVNK